MVTYNDNGLKSGNKTAHIIAKKLQFCMTLTVTDQKLQKSQKLLLLTFISR